MIKKSITYENFDGETVTEDHYFHLSKADLVEMELSHEGGMSTWLESIIASNDGKTIIEEFKKLVQSSYGKKSPDGRRFIKSDEDWEEFVSSEAYSTMFMELVTDAQAAADFVNGIVPKGLEQDMAKVGQDQMKLAEVPRGIRGEVPPPGDRRVITRVEALEMPAEELSRLLASGEAVLGDSSEG